jgi:hypothetical protein
MGIWLQKRLNELEMTHDDFVERLAEFGIIRTRVTITNWVNGSPIKPLMNPAETKLLALALYWSVDELLIEAGYDIGTKGLTVPRELFPHVRLFKKLKKPHSDRYLESIDFVGQMLKQIQDNDSSSTDAPRTDVAEVDGIQADAVPGHSVQADETQMNGAQPDDTQIDGSESDFSEDDGRE